MAINEWSTKYSHHIQYTVCYMCLYDHTIDTLWIMYIPLLGDLHLLNWIKENAHRTFDVYIFLDDDSGDKHMDAGMDGIAVFMPFLMVRSAIADRLQAGQFNLG